MNVSVSIARVISMVSILFCHLFNWLQIYTYQLFSVGVNVFLIISGYLYGNKLIPSKREFFLGRLKRVLVPFYIVASYIYIYIYIYNMQSEFKFNWLQVLTFVLNLQGIRSIFFQIPGDCFSVVSGLSHCWFLTVIFVSYILMVFLKDSFAESNIEKNLCKYFIISIILQIGLSYCGIQIAYILCFFIGYFFSRLKFEKTENRRNFWILTLLTVVIGFTRIVLRKYIDSTIFYDRVVATWSFNLLGLWLFCMIDYLCQIWHSAANTIVNSKIWKHFDSLSYPIFLTHYMFMNTPFDLSNYISNAVLRLTCFVAMTLLVSEIIFRFTKKRSCLK